MRTSLSADNNNNILIVFLLIIIQSTIADTLVCYDGADCLQTDSCSECSGVGCMRLKSYSTEHLHTVALTCLPYATRPYQLEPAGCRISLSGDGEYCICYDNDYCNRATTSLLLFSFRFIPFVIVFLLVFF